MLARAYLTAKLVLCILLTIFVYDVDSKLVPKVSDTLENINRASIAVGYAAGNLERASREWEADEKTQAPLITSDMRRFASILTNLDGLTSDARSTLNTQSILLSSLEQQGLLTMRDGSTFLASAQPLVQQLGKSAEQLTQAGETLNTQILPQLGSAVSHANAASDSLASMAASGKRVSDHYEQVILHPIRTFWTHARDVSDWMLKGLEAHAYWPF